MTTKTIEIKGWIYASVSEYSDKLSYEFNVNDFEKWARNELGGNWARYRKIMPHTITVEVPSDIDPRSLMLAALERERENVRAELGRRIAEINDKISKVTAIEFTPTESAEVPF